MKQHTSLHMLSSYCMKVVMPAFWTAVNAMGVHSPITTHPLTFLHWATASHTATASGSLQLGTLDQRMKSPEGIEVLVNTLRSHSNLSNTYCVKEIVLCS